MGSWRLCRGWHAFLQSPDKWAGFPCHDKVVQMAMQKPWQRCVGQQPYWHCHGSRICHGTKSLISWIKPDRIDLWSWLLSCPGCWRQLPIPSVLYVGLILKLYRCRKTVSVELCLITRQDGWHALLQLWVKRWRPESCKCAWQPWQDVCQYQYIRLCPTLGLIIL